MFVVDIFALSVAHAALLIALWRLTQRRDLDQEGEAPLRRRPPGRNVRDA